MNHNKAQEKPKNETANACKVVNVGKETNKEQRKNDQAEILEQFKGGVSQKTPMVEDEHKEERDDTKLPSCWTNL